MQGKVCVLFSIAILAGLTTGLEAAAPANDECVNAICVSDGDAVAGTTTESTGTGLNSSCAFLGDPNDVWYVYTPAVPEVVTFGVCDSEMDTTVSVFTSCGAGELACNDDSDVCDLFSLQSVVSVSLLAQQTYWIRVAGSEGQWGDFVLTVSGGQGDCSAPVCMPLLESDTNDDCVINLLDYLTLTSEWLQCHLQPASACP